MRQWVPTLGTASQCVCILVLLSVSGVLWCDDEELVARPAVFAVVVRPASTSGSERYCDAIEQLIRITVRVAGATTLGESVMADPETQTAELEPLLEQVRTTEAEYLISSVYDDSEDEVSLSIRLSDVASGEVLAQTDRTMTVDFSFDSVVIDAVEEILVAAEDGLIRYEAAPAAVATTSEPETMGAAPRATALEPVTLPPFPRLEFAAGGAPLLPVGKGSDYFKVGLFSSLSAAVRFRVGVIRFGVGLESGTSLFDAEGASSSAQALVAPIGALFVWTLSYGTPVELTFRLSGGAALLSMSISGLEGRLSKMVPYASGGLGINLLLGPSFAIAVDTRFSAYFEQAYGELSPLYGIAPAIFLVLRV